MFKPRTNAGAHESGARGSALARRMALRDIRANKSTSALILSLIALPMMIMVLVATLMDSATPTGTENATKQLGGFDLQLVGNEYPVGSVQNPNDPFQVASEGESTDEEKTSVAADVPAMLAVLDAGASSTVVRSGFLKDSGTEGAVRLEMTVGEFSDPRFAGRYTLASGTWGGPDAVLINEDLASVSGLGLGDRLPVGNADYPISGILKNSSGKGLYYQGLGVSLGLEGYESPELFVSPEHPAAEELEENYAAVYVEGMTLDLQRQEALNAMGIGSYVRDFIINAPPSELWSGSSDEDKLAEALIRFATIFVIGFFVFLEVGLLAGAAFAVGAKKQRRTFALLSANGAEGATIRSIGAYSGLFLGGIAVLLGTVLGLAGAWGITRWSERNAAGFPGWHVPFGAVAALMCLGLASAVVAALLPARSVSRNAGLSALRADGNPSARPKRPVIGYVLLGLGLASWAVALVAGLSATTYGQLNNRSGVVMIGFVAGIGLCTIGLMLSIGRLLWFIGDAGHRLPLAGRLAVRDIQRNHGRTVPAIAAVIAGTALATALALAAGISTAAAGYQGTAMPSTLHELYLSTGFDESLPVDEEKAAAQAAAIIEQLERSGYAPRASSQYGLFFAGYKYPGTDKARADQWIALLAPGSICRYGQDDMYSRTAPDLAGLLARDESLARSIRDGDRFTARYCGIDPGSTGSIVRGETPAHITDRAGLELILGRHFTAAVGAAFDQGRAIVTVPEFVTDQHQVSFGIPDAGLPVVENGEFYGSSVGALVGLPLTRSFEIDALEVLVPETRMPRIMMSKDAVKGTGGSVMDSTLLVDLGRTLDRDETTALNKDLAHLDVRIYSNNELMGSNRLMAMLPWLLAIAAGLLVLTTAAMTTGLALADGRRDARVMVGVGAAQGTRRRFGAVQSGFTALLGTVLGILLGAMPVGLLMFVMNGSLDPWLLAPLTVLLAIPPLAALIGWFMVPREVVAARVGS